VGGDLDLSNGGSFKGKMRNLRRERARRRRGRRVLNEGFGCRGSTQRKRLRRREKLRACSAGAVCERIQGRPHVF